MDNVVVRYFIALVPVLPSFAGIGGLGHKMREMLFLKVTFINGCVG